MADITHLCLTGSMLLYTSVLQILMCQVATLSTLLDFTFTSKHIIWVTCGTHALIPRTFFFHTYVFLSFQSPGVSVLCGTLSVDIMRILCSVGPTILVTDVMDSILKVKPYPMEMSLYNAGGTVTGLKSVNISQWEMTSVHFTLIAL